MSRHAILVVGDVMLDRRVDGEMRRISPEAPAPVIRQDSILEMPGGAANVAANIAALGRKTYLLGVVGDDYAGQTLGHMLPTQYNVNSNLIRRGDTVTITKTKITASGQQVLRIDDEQDFVGGPTASHQQDVQNALNALHGDHSDVGMVVVADYAKGTITRPIAEWLSIFCGEQGIPMFVDTKPCHFEMYGRPYKTELIKPNLREALEICQGDVHPALAETSPEEDKAEVLCQNIYMAGLYDKVVITRGGNGATFYDGEELFTSSVATQEVFDVTGAGDTFMAVLADARLAEFDWPSAILRANTAASEAVRHHGTTIVGRARLEEAVKNRLGLLGKILTREKAIQYTSRQRQAEQRVVLANGCFRYIHHGHWEMLRWSKRQGDILVVAANSDSSIRELRGEVPFIPQTYRGEMLAAIPFVDAVVFFDEACAEQIVRDLHPDILVKGQEYQSNNCPGADWLARKGGEVRFAPMIEGIHATNLTPPTG